MLLDHRRGSALNKGFVFQFVLGCSQLVFNFCNFLIQSLSLPCSVRGGDGQKISPRGVIATGFPGGA